MRRKRMIDLVQPFLLDLERLRRLEKNISSLRQYQVGSKVEDGDKNKSISVNELEYQVPSKMKNAIYEIDINGILYGGEFFDGVFDLGGKLGLVSVQSIKLTIKKALLKKPLAIVLKIDSPGGTVAGIADLADYIYSLRSVVPIYTYSPGIMASAAYWVGSSARKLFISQTTLVGSIGVVTTIYDDRAYYKKKGIKIQNVINDDSPDKDIDYFSPSGKANLKKKLNAIAEIFFAAVARNREKTPEEIKSCYGKGDTLLGVSAFRAGMVDGVLSYDDFKRKLEGRHLKEGEKTNTVDEGLNYDDFKQKIGAYDMREISKTKLKKPSLEGGALEMKDFKKGEIEGIAKERERVVAILALPGDMALKAKVIERGLPI